MEHCRQRWPLAAEGWGEWTDSSPLLAVSAAPGNGTELQLSFLEAAVSAAPGNRTELQLSFPEAAVSAAPAAHVCNTCKQDIM